MAVKVTVIEVLLETTGIGIGKEAGMMKEETEIETGEEIETEIGIRNIDMVENERAGELNLNVWPY